MSETRDYTNGEVTIHWNQALCTHSGRCVRGLPAVFDVKARPWINPLGATTEDIIRQVEHCPSGALTYTRTPPENPQSSSEEAAWGEESEPT